MSSSEKIDLLIKQAEQKQGFAKQKVAESLQKLDSAQKNQQQLQQFKQEYQQKLNQITSKPIDAHTLLNYQKFVEQIDTTISQAEKTVAQSRQEVAERQVELNKETTEVKRYSHLYEKHQKHLFFQRESRSQQELDEAAQNSFTQRNSY